MSFIKNIIETIKAARLQSYGGEGYTLLSQTDRKAIPFQGSGGDGGNFYSISNNITRATTVDDAIRRFAGTRVDFERETGDLVYNSLVMSAVNWAGTTFPEVPLQVRERNSEGRETIVEKHPFIELLDRPNEYYSGELLWKASLLSWIINGNVYWLKWRNSRQQVIGLWYEPHFTIRPVWPIDGSEFLSGYEIWRNGKWISVPTVKRNGKEIPDVVHMRYNIDPNNPRLGISPIASILRELYTDNEASTYSALIMKNCGVPPLLASPKPQAQGISPEEVMIIEDKLNRKLTQDERGKILVTSGPIDITKLGFNYAELGLEKLRRLPEERLASAVGIPAMVLGFGAGLERSTYDNYAEAREAAYEGFIIPTQRLMLSQLRHQLFAEIDTDPNRFLVFDLSKVRVLQEDVNAQFKRWSDTWLADVCTRAEARAALGMQVDESRDNIFYSQSKASLGTVLMDAFEQGGNPNEDVKPNGKAYN